MEVKCETCGKLFDKPKNRIDRTKSGKHFCSKECYQKNPIITQEKTGREIACDYCGSIVYRSFAQLARSKSGKHFCSKQCSKSFIGEQVQGRHNTVCDNCGSSFRKSPSTIGKTNYCNRDCWKEHIQSDGPSYYRKFKKEKCRECGFIPENKCQLDVHHADGDKNNNDEENLVTLCANCHRLLHYLAREGMQL